MGKDKEPLDSLIGRIATGIHAAAAATIAAPGSTREELDLAALILRRDPERSAPRESASSIETFNRLLDVALDSANNSAHCGTRAERRVRLAADLGAAAVVLIDSSMLADLVAAKLELADRGDEGESLGGELLDAARDAAFFGLGVTFVSHDELEHIPLAEFFEGTERGDAANPNVND